MYIMLLLIVGVIGIMAYPEFFFVTGLIFFGGAIGYMIANERETHDNIEDTSDMSSEERAEYIKKLVKDKSKEEAKISIKKYYRKDFDPNDPEVVKEREELKKFIEEQQRKADEELEREKATETNF